MLPSTDAATVDPTDAGPIATPLAPGVHLLDLRFQGVSGAVAAFLIAHRDALVLVETGPGSTLPALRAAAQAAGHELAAVTHVVVTHIHLDHAGAAGAVLREAPRARLYVHPAGAAHLVDPSKLLASATRIYGDRMDALWGAFEPVPADRLHTLADGEAIALGGGRALTAWHTPGHAQHHVALHDAELGDVYVGDVGGVRLGGAPHVRAPTPPPDVDLDAWDASVRRLRALAPARLLLTHFGAYADVPWHLDALLAGLHAWVGWIEGRLEHPNADPAALTRDAERRGTHALARALGDVDAETLARLTRAYELATPSYMTVSGVARYLKRRES